jgi:hypothetical protein
MLCRTAIRVTPHNQLHYSLDRRHEMVAGREVLRGGRGTFSNKHGTWGA